MVHPFVGEEVSVGVVNAHYQDEKRGTLEEADDHGIRLILKDRPNHRIFLPWNSVRSIEHDNQ